MQVAVAVAFGRGGAVGVVAAVLAASRRRFCSSQKMFTLLRGVTCVVMRALAFCHVLSLNACRDKSGSYSHLFGSPAFLL